jgi:hypothetical protein
MSRDAAEPIATTTTTTTPAQWLLLTLAGAIGGGALALDLLAFAESAADFSTRKVAALILAGAVAGAVGCAVVRVMTVRLVGRLRLEPATLARFGRLDMASYLVALLFLAGAIGIRFSIGLIGCVAAGMILIKAAALLAALPRESRAAWFTSLPYLALLFFVSGFAALIYQIVWQRVLFADYGVNIESITIIVSLFMAGLGVGSLIGGALSRRFPGRAPQLFLACELLMGLFGTASLPLIHAVSAATLNGNLVQVSVAIYALLCVPTILMGATLPILVGHLHRHYHNVGKSVGMLYCINTLGSAAACFATTEVLFAFGGERAAVILAALCNFVVGVLVYRYAARIASTAEIAPREGVAGVFADDAGEAIEGLAP